MLIKTVEICSVNRDTWGRIRCFVNNSTYSDVVGKWPCDPTHICINTKFECHLTQTKFWGKPNYTISGELKVNGGAELIHSALVDFHDFKLGSDTPKLSAQLGYIFAPIGNPSAFLALIIGISLTYLGILFIFIDDSFSKKKIYAGKLDSIDIRPGYKKVQLEGLTNFLGNSNNLIVEFEDRTETFRIDTDLEDVMSVIINDLEEKTIEMLNTSVYNTIFEQLKIYGSK